LRDVGAVGRDNDRSGAESRTLREGHAELLERLLRRGTRDLELVVEVPAEDEGQGTEDDEEREPSRDDGPSPAETPATDGVELCGHGSLPGRREGGYNSASSVGRYGPVSKCLPANQPCCCVAITCKLLLLNC